MIALSFLVMPAPSGCMSQLMSGVRDDVAAACHMQSVLPLNSSWALPTSTTPAVVPSVPYALLLLAVALLMTRQALHLDLPVAIARRLRFLRHLWATTLPFKDAIPRVLPYFAPQRDA